MTNPAVTENKWFVIGALGVLLILGAWVFLRKGGASLAENGENKACSEIAFDWIQAAHAQRYPGKFTLGSHEKDLLSKVPDVSEGSIPQFILSGSSAAAPIREGLPHFLATCDEFSKTVAIACPTLVKNRPDAHMPEAEFGVLLFRTLLAETISSAQAPVDLEQLSVEQFNEILASQGQCEGQKP